MKQELIIISGPTACGKTAVSVELAKLCGGEIISADSMQVYKGMDIGTAKVTRDEMQGIPHFLIDISALCEEIYRRHFFTRKNADNSGRYGFLYKCRALRQ